MANPSPMPHPENLTPFQPGQSGNPEGSSKTRRITAALLKLLEGQKLDATLSEMIEARGMTEVFALAGLTAAIGGDFQFWSYIYDRIEGKMVPEVPEPTSGRLEDLVEEAERRAADRLATRDLAE